MRKNEAKASLFRIGRMSMALALGLSMALGGTPAAALAEEATTPQIINGTTEAGGTSLDSIAVSADSPVTALTVESLGADGAEVKASVAGDVSASSNTEAEPEWFKVTTGVFVDDSYASSGGTTVDVGGNVKASEQTTTTPVRGVEIHSHAGQKDVVNVGGTITAEMPDSWETAGVYISLSKDGEVVLNAKGIEALGENACAIYIGDSDWGDQSSVDGAKSLVVVDGDVTSAGEQGNNWGVLLYSSADNTITITGTLTADAGLGIGDGFDPSNTTLNVWKIVSDYIADNDGEQIRYIVKYADEGQKDYFKLLNEGLGVAQVGNVDYSTVKSGENLRFSVPERAGYVLKDVIGLDSDVLELGSLTKNEDGTYTLVVPNSDGIGGGILLKAIWEAVTPEAEPEKDAPAAEELRPAVKPAASGAATELPATSDPLSAAAAVQLALAGVAAVLASRKLREE